MSYSDRNMSRGFAILKLYLENLMKTLWHKFPMVLQCYSLGQITSYLALSTVQKLLVASVLNAEVVAIDHANPGSSCPIWPRLTSRSQAPLVAYPSLGTKSHPKPLKI